MENNRFKNRISRMFRGSFTSCRTRNLSDVMESSVFVPHNKYRDLDVIESCNTYLPPKPRPFPSICRPTCPESKTQVVNYSILPRQKVCARYPPCVLANSGRGGHTCPPASPISPLKEKKKKSSSAAKSKKKKKNTNKKEMTSLFSSSSHDSAYFDWFSSEGDDELDTLVSSRIFSSDSSGSHHRRRKKRTSHRRRASATTATGKSSQMDVLPLMDGKVKDSFAVVKSSSDPYNDFRTSMVEMIIEKQIFSARDLEHLLQCFLSLNSYNHHRIIVEVFTEIWEALFSNWS